MSGACSQSIMVNNKTNKRMAYFFISLCVLKKKGMSNKIVKTNEICISDVVKK